MHRRTEFKRMIVGLPQSAGDYSRVGVTAQFAELLKLRLVAMCSEDRNLMHIAGLPCVRELRPLGEGWQSIDAGRLATELTRSLTTVRQRFVEAVRHCRIETSFRVEERHPADIIGSVATPDDIIAIIEPRNPAERVTQQFTRLVEAAFAAAASVMLIPSQVSRSAGPIVALARHPDDPSIEVAAGIAAALREKLIIMAPSDMLRSRLSLPGGPDAADMAVELAEMGRTWPDVPALAAQLRRWNERCVVMTRGALEDAQAPKLASLQAVPVFLVRPPDESADR